MSDGIAAIVTVRRLFILGAVLAVAGLLHAALFRWGVENSHRRFLGSIEDRKWNRVGKLVSDEYGDRFEFGEKELMAAIRDVGGQFIFSLTIDWTLLEKSREGNAVTLRGNIQLDGNGTPAAAEIVRRAQRYRSQPVEFTWQRESAWPWSWRLVEIDLPGLDLPPSYDPGEFGRGGLEF